MKLLAATAAILLVVFSLVADYQWKRWVKLREQARRNDREN